MVVDELLGIIPYIYFFDESIRLGPVTFIGVPDLHRRKHTVATRADALLTANAPDN